MKEIQSFETSVTACLVTQRHIPEELIFNHAALKISKLEKKKNHSSNSGSCMIDRSEGRKCQFSAVLIANGFIADCTLLFSKFRLTARNDLHVTGPCSRREEMNIRRSVGKVLSCCCR
jgi:hypothetical protein